MKKLQAEMIVLKSLLHAIKTQKALEWIQKEQHKNNQGSSGPRRQPLWRSNNDNISEMLPELKKLMDSHPRGLNGNS